MDINAYIQQHTQSDDSKYRLLMENYLKGKNEMSNDGLAESYLEHYMQKRKGSHDEILQRNRLAQYMDELLNNLNLYD